jgi:hypothetical protein
MRPMTNDSDSRSDVLSPEGPHVAPSNAGPSGLTSIADAKIAQLWDYRFRGDEIFAHLRDELTQRYPGVQFVDYEVFGNVHGHREDEILEALPGLLKEHGCNAVLAGIGA